MNLNFSKNKILNLVTGPFFLAIPVTLLFYLLFPPDISPYSLSIEDSQPWTKENSTQFYADLDSDSIRERLYLYNYVTFATIIAYNPSGSIYETWNLKGDWFELPAYELADLNKNGIAELLSVTITKGDSVFAGYTELGREKSLQHFRFVTKIKRYNGQRDCKINTIGMSDITGDGREDFLFCISAGFTLQPRAIYAWDLQNDLILRSPFSGLNLKNSISGIFRDLDGDSVKEVFLMSVATDNYKKPISLSDTASYAVVLTKELKFFFPPVYSAGRTSMTGIFPVGKKGDNQTLSIIYDRRKDIAGHTFRKIDNKGKMLGEKQMIESAQSINYFPSGENIITSVSRRNQTEFIMIDKDLNEELKMEIDGNFSIAEVADIDLDREKEIMACDYNDGVFCILEPDFQKPAILQTGRYSGKILNLSVIHADRYRSGLYVQTNNFLYEFEYAKNRLYRFRYFFIMLFYLGISLFLFFIQKIFIFRNNRKKAISEKMVNYQLQAIMNQLNPHFTFNAINSIGGAILTGRNEEAYLYLTRLSTLIRKSMQNAFQPYKTLEEEIDFVEEYLVIEKYRFEERFTWEIKVSPEVNKKIIIPKMLIHVFIENAIKHGLFHDSGQGRIEILIQKVKKSTVITIRDNGVGIQKAAVNKKDTGSGLKILKNYLELFKEIRKTSIHFEIRSNESTEDSKSGTTVIIRIEHSGKQ